MRKGFWILLNSILLALVCGASYFLFTSWKERKLHDFIIEKQTALQPASQSLLREGNIGSAHILAYLPADGENKVIQPLEEVVEKAVQEEFGQDEPSGSIDQIGFVTFSESPTSFSTVREVELKKSLYQVELIDITEKEQKDLGRFLVTEDNQLFTINLLFKNQSKAMEILAKNLQEQAGQTDPAKREETKQKLEGLVAEEIVVDYQNSQFFFTFPEMSGLSPIALPVEAFYGPLNGKYLTEADAKAYEEYKEKKAKEKMIALTFDDGPNPATTPQILDALKKHDAKATFFILGQNIPGNEEILKRIVAEGHEVANHTLSHPNLATLSTDQIKQEIEETQRLIKEATGQTPQVMRPPYGAFNQTVMDTMGLPAIHWSVDTLDWQSRDPQAILSQVQSSTYPGSVILMHDIHQPTADAVPSVLEYLNSQGYSFGTISELLGDELHPQHVYYDRTRNEPAQ